MVLEALWGALQLKVSNGMGLGTVHPVLKPLKLWGFFFYHFGKNIFWKLWCFPA